MSSVAQARHQLRSGARGDFRPPKAVVEAGEEAPADHIGGALTGSGSTLRTELVECQAAIHDQGLARDVGRPVDREEHHGGCELLRVA